MTLKELCAYLGYVTPNDIFEHIKAGKLPPPLRGLGVLDRQAQWDKAEVDRANAALRPDRGKR